jgi:phenylpropionate dioxygenase-like ring-hydroxylating dioxygenase large terminal subunit
MNVNVPPTAIPNTAQPMEWPEGALTRIPYWIYQSPEITAREQQRLFEGPVWNFLCLEAEVQKAGDYRVTAAGSMPVVVARDFDDEIYAFENRCAHRGALIALDTGGHARDFTCVYHAWNYDLKGNLKAVAFEDGVNGKGGMDETFCRADHGPRKLRIANFCGLVFGSLSDDVPPIEEYLGDEIAAKIKRVLHKPVTVTGRFTQMLPNNWKLYFENVKDTYHASILHSFLTTFRINRLSMPGSINIDESGGNHFSQAKLDYAAEDADYKTAQLRSDTDLKLRDPSIVQAHDEYGDQVSVQILTVFPNMVLQQVRNTIAVRVIRPRGVDRTELDWVHLGFDDDDEAMAERRLRQGNLIGAAGYIALEDGCVGGFVQRALRYNDDDSGVVMMGGHEAQSQNFRASEAAIRGFWKKYRALTGT